MALKSELDAIYENVQIWPSSVEDCVHSQIENILAQNPGISVVHLGKIPSNNSPSNNSPSSNSPSNNSPSNNSPSNKETGIHLWLQEGHKRTYFLFAISPWEDAGELSLAVLNMSEEISASRDFPSDKNMPPSPTDKKSTHRHLVFLGVGGGILGIPNFGTFGILMGDITWRPFSHLSFSFRGAGTISQRELFIGQHSIYTQLALGQGWVNVDFANPSVVTPSLGVGGGFVIVNMKGNQVTNPTEISNSDRIKIGYMGVKTSLRFQLAQMIYLNTGFQLGMQLPTIQVRFPDGETAQLNRFILEGFVAIEILLRQRQ